MPDKRKQSGPDILGAVMLAGGLSIFLVWIPLYFVLQHLGLVP